MHKKKKNKQNRGIVLIKKSNNLIESRYGFDIWETRIFLSILSQIRREDEEFKVYRIWFKDVIGTFGLKSGDSYGYLRSAAQSLMGKSFYISYENEGIVREKQYHILREIDYLQEGQVGTKAQNHEYIDVTIEQKMKPLLLQLQKNFTAYDLRNIVKLGVYPIRIYELLKQYQSIGKRTLRIEEMKIMFEVADKYALFGDFYRWIVQPAVKQINQYTDLTIVDIKKIKEGRRVTALRFTFKLKNSDGIKEAHDEGEKKLGNKLKLESGNNEVLKPLKHSSLFLEFKEVVVESFGVTPSTFSRMLETGKYQKEDIRQAISVTRRAKYHQEITKNIAGFFLKALREGYTDTKEENQKKEWKLKKQKENQKLLAQRIDGLERERDILIHDKIRLLTTKDSNITQNAINAVRESVGFVITKREERLGRKLDVEDFRKDKMLRELVKEKIIMMNKEHFAEILQDFEKKVGVIREA